MSKAAQQRVLVLDFGSQYAQLIARRVREQQVYCELHSFDVSEQFIRDFKPNGIILSGGAYAYFSRPGWTHSHGRAISASGLECFACSAGGRLRSSSSAAVRAATAEASSAGGEPFSGMSTSVVTPPG